MSAEATGWAFKFSPYKGIELALHLALADSANDTYGYEIWARQSWIAAKANCSRERANKWLKKAVDDGFLKMLEDNSALRKPNRYRFLMPPSKPQRWFPQGEIACDETSCDDMSYDDTSQVHVTNGHTACDETSLDMCRDVTQNPIEPKGNPKENPTSSSLPLSESTRVLNSVNNEPITTPNPKGPGDRSTPKPKKSKSDLTPVDPSIIRLCELLADLVEENGFTRPDPAKKEWQTAARLMITKDGRSSQDVEAVIRWCQADSFWYKNIRSMDKLRIQFERLWVEVDEKSSTKRTRTPRPRASMTSRLDAIIAKGEAGAD